jgi:hypothetical protein
MKQNPQQPSSPAGANATPPETHYVIDENHRGMVVSAFDYPQGWKAWSRVVWNFQDSSQPLTCDASVFNPRGTEAVEFLQAESCFWLAEPPHIYPLGQKFRGLTCLPPMSAPDALIQFAIPLHRRNVRVMYVQAVPNLAQMLGINWLLSLRHEGVMARVEYEMDGRTFEEDFFACVLWQTPYGGQLNWGLPKFFSLRAARGVLDSVWQELWNVVASMRFNPRWSQLHTQIMQQLFDGVKMQHNLTMDRLGREKAWGEQMRQYREWESDLHQQTVNHRWASQERMSERMGDVLGGYQRFHDPNSASGVHRDYSLSQYSWTNGYRWIHRNDAMYDPNTDPNESRNGPWTLSNPIR